jgi:hypothetical protein
MRPGPAALGLRFAVVRQPRDPGSVRAPVAGLVIVLLVLVGALTFGASLDRFVAEPNRQGTTFDLGVGQGGDVIPDRARAALVADRDVAAVAAYGTVLASVGSASLDVTGIEPLRGDLRPDVLEGSFPADDDEIALGRLSARALHVEVGDELADTGSGGVISYRVTALAVITSVEGGDGIGEGAMVTLPGLRRLAPDATLGSAGIRLRPGAPAGTAERLSADAGVLVTDEVDPPPTVRNLEQVRSTPFLVALALGVLAVLSLAQQLSTSTRRRRRDLAVLRALGVERSWVTRVLHWQATALAALAALVAVPLGVAAGGVAYEGFFARTGARDDISVPLALISLAMGGLVLLANLTAVLPAGRARRDRPATVFADE